MEIDISDLNKSELCSLIQTGFTGDKTICDITRVEYDSGWYKIWYNYFNSNLNLLNKHSDFCSTHPAAYWSTSIRLSVDLQSYVDSYVKSKNRNDKIGVILE